MTAARFVYAPELSRYPLPASHPFKPERLDLTRSLLLHTGLLGAGEQVGVAPLPEARLTDAHEPEYVALVKAVSRGERSPEAFGRGLGTGDNPIFPGMHQAILGVCAATVTAVDLVVSGAATRAVNLAGGLHHAMPGKASGFCVYNDLALGIKHATSRGLRVAYIDLDAHHGDGVQWIFYDDPDVLTVSLHESGRYLFPGTGHTYETGRGPGRGLSVNAPLEPFTEDDSFLEVLEAVVPPALEHFRPDLIVLQAGADMHRHDPLADLALTLAGMRRGYRLVSELADAYCGGRLVATGGGGYDAYRTVPRAWAHLWAVLTGRRLPERLPAAWREEWQARSPTPLPEASLDEPADFEPLPRRALVSGQNRAMLGRLAGALDHIRSGAGTGP